MQLRILTECKMQHNWSCYGKQCKIKTWHWLTVLFKFFCCCTESNYKCNILSCSNFALTLAFKWYNFLLSATTTSTSQNTESAKKYQWWQNAAPINGTEYCGSVKTNIRLPVDAVTTNLKSWENQLSKKARLKEHSQPKWLLKFYSKMYSYVHIITVKM